LVGLCARALVSFWIVPSWESSARVADSPDRYPTLARELVEHRAFGYGAEGATPTTVRGPAFPVWLALPLAAGVEGPQSLGLWGALPMVLLAAWLARLLQKHHGAIVGFAAGLLIVLHPLPAFASGRVMGDEFYGAAGFAGLAMLARPWSAAALKRTAGSAALAALAGALISVATLARATGVLFLLAAVASIVFVKECPRGARLLAVLSLVLAALLPPLGWSWRCSRLEGRPVFVHSLAAYNFWYGEVLDRIGPTAQRGETHAVISAEILRIAGLEGQDPHRFWYVRLTPTDSAHIEAALGRASLARITSDPGGFAARVVRGLGWFWFRGETASRTRQYLLAMSPVLVIALWGGLCVWRRRREEPTLRLIAVFVLVLLLHQLAYAATLPVARMAVQIFPALATLFGFGIADLWQRRTGRRREQAPPPSP
jgi:hypothetical protein